MSRLKHICIITPEHWSHCMGGIEYQVKLLTDRLSQRSDIRLTYLAGRVAGHYSPHGHRLIQIAGSSVLRRYGHFFDAGRLLRLLGKIKPDVIYENGGCSYIGISAYYALKNGCRSIWHIASDNDLVNKRGHSLLKPHMALERTLLQWGIRKTDLIIAQSDFQKHIAAKRNPRAAIHLVRNFHPAPHEHQPENKTDQIAWVANFKRLKQPELFIDLSEELQRRMPNIRCVMVGTPTTYPEGYQKALEVRMGKIANLIYRGGLPVDEVNGIIASSKLLINTSKWEGFPNTFIQSWMRKTPVVSLHCDPDHVMRDHQCGIVSGGIGQMVDDVVRLLSNEKQRAEMGESAYRYAMSHHSIDNLKRLEEIILN